MANEDILLHCGRCGVALSIRGREQKGAFQILMFKPCGCGGSAALRVVNEDDEDLIRQAEEACPWADLPGSCREWLDDHTSLTRGQREALESLVERAADGEFDRD